MSGHPPSRYSLAPQHHLRQPSLGGSALPSSSASLQSSALQRRVDEKKQQLEDLVALRDLSGNLASQMQQLEEKLTTLANGTEAVATVMSNWQNVLRAIAMASTALPKQKAAEAEDDPSAAETHHDEDDEEARFPENEEGMLMPQVLVRIPVPDQDEK